MSKTTMIFTLSWIFMFFCLASFSSPSSDEEKIDLKIKGQIMSAELQGVPLRLILEKLKREKGIWYKGSEPELGEKRVSIWFKDLPLEQGLRRILSGMDHVLLFDQEKGLVGLVIFGKKESRWVIARDEPRTMEKGLSSESFKDATVSRNPFETPSNPFRLATPKAKSTGTTRGENFPFSQDPHTENSDEALPSDKNPFVLQNPFPQEFSSSPENPFNENVSPTPENPFLNPNPFGASQ